MGCAVLKWQQPWHIAMFMKIKGPEHIADPPACDGFIKPGVFLVLVLYWQHIIDNTQVTQPYQ